MRARFVIFLLVAVTIVLAVVFWLGPIKPQITEPSTPAAVQSSNVVTANTSFGKPNASNLTARATEPQIATNSRPSVANNAGMQALTRQFVNGRNKQINFYGQVIDQDSNALSDVEVKSVVEQITMPDALSQEFLGSKSITVMQTTDARGRFEISGLSGEGFGIVLTKGGYEMEPDHRSFGPSGGSYETPVIFKMWSTNIHEKLLTGDKSFEIVPDGRFYFINLTDGTISESVGGDLKVWIQYTNNFARGQLYDWSAGIEVIDGGLLEVSQNAINSGFLTDPPFAMFSAPTSGYIPSFSFKSQIKGGQDGEIGNRFFYLALKNGNEYGRVSINLFAPYGYLHPGLVRLSYAINPSGSHILR